MRFKFNPLIVRQSNATHSGAVVFLHGTGDTGRGMRDWIKLITGFDLHFPHLQIVYPTAPKQPFTPLYGALTNTWFDRYIIGPDIPENLESLDNIAKDMVKFIKFQVAENIPINRIIIGGFSMGGCLALHMAYRYLPEFAGVFTVSSFLSDDSFVYEDLGTANDNRKKIPLLMCHGDGDQTIPIQWGEYTYNNLMKFGINAQFITFKNIDNELKKPEFEKLNEWILKVLPQLPSDKN